MFFYILYCIFVLISTMVERLSSIIPLPLRNAFSAILRPESTTMAQRSEEHASSLYLDCGHRDLHRSWSGPSATDCRASNEVAIVRQNVDGSVTLFYKTIAGPQKYCPLPTTMWKSYKLESSDMTISMEKELESEIAVESDVDTVASTASYSEFDRTSDDSESDDDSLTDVSEDHGSPKDYDLLCKQGGNRLHLSEHVSFSKNTHLQAFNTAEEILRDTDVACITEGISTTSGHSHQPVGLDINHNTPDFDGLATVDQSVIEAQLARVLEALRNASADSYDLTGPEVCNSTSVLDSSTPVETHDLLVFGTNEDMSVQDISTSESRVLGDLIELEMATIHGEHNSSTCPTESYRQFDVDEPDIITHMSSHDLLGLDVEDKTPKQDNAFASASTGLKDLVGLEMAATPGKPDTCFDPLNDVVSPVSIEEGNVGAMEEAVCFSLDSPPVRSFTAAEASAQEVDDCACPLEICETYFAPYNSPEQSDPAAKKAENNSVPRTKSSVSLPEIPVDTKEELSPAKFSRSLSVSDMVEAAMNDRIYEASRKSESPENNATEFTTGTTTDILTTMGEKPDFPYGTGWRVVVPTRFVVTENSTRILSFVDRTYEQFRRAQEPVITTKPGVYTQEVPLNEPGADEDWEMVLV
ncbi:hypothetical protein S40293_10898 [Stachybotrys chartarum IBT 40293]|nr:hypothetical protein S40293_10898 [Stachybotrys chartarum IBT 40293]